MHDEGIFLTSAVLALEDGASFEAIQLARWNGVGEVVFNTSMTGYQEIIPDPS